MKVSHVVALAATALAVLLYFMVPPAGIPAAAFRGGAVAVFTIGLLATRVIPEALSAVVFFFLAVVLAVAPPAVVFSGFASGAAWLVFGGLIIGVAIRETGLGRRIAGLLVRLFPPGYTGVVTGIVVLTALLAFLVPSSAGRVVIMLPIVMALADRLGFVEGRAGRAGMLMAVPSGTLLPTFAILPANVPNAVLMGAAESIHGVHLTYGTWLQLHFPVIGIVTIVALPLFLITLFRDSTDGRPEEAPMTPLTAPEIRLLAVLAAALLLWVTDSWHGVSPAWVSLGAGIVCLLPVLGVIPAMHLVEKVNYAPWLFVTGVIGLGAVVADSGMAAVLGDRLFAWLDLNPGEDGRNFAAVVGLGMVMAMFTTFPGQPAMMTAMADTIAAATGWPLLTVLMAQVPSWGLIPFPYEAPPLVLAMQLAGLRMRHMLRFLLPFTLFGWLVLIPLEFLWWRYLGYFG